MNKCESIHESILKHLSDLTLVEQHRDLCVVTLPIRTVDGRLVDVFVEERAGDYFLVHDASKAANELILTGVNMTASMKSSFERLAASFGIQMVNETFQTTCKAAQLNSALLGVAMCSSMATMHLLEHVARTDEDTVRDQFGAALKIWVRRRATLKERVSIGGKWRQHSFDFVAYPKNSTPIAFSVVSPSGNSAAAADRAAFRAKDLEDTRYAGWRKVIVEARSEEWTGPAKNLLAKCSDMVIEINSGDAPTLATVNEKMRQLEAA